MRRYTALSALLFLFVILMVQHEYRFHNKYTIASQQNTAFLLKGMLYPDVLLFPKEIKQHTGIPVLTGSYQNLSAFHEDESGFGKATMVFTYTTDKPGIKQLYLQELFSAAKLYINGKPVAQSGSFEPYQEQIQDILITFQEERENTILIQCENRSHYYTGVQYPPILGDADTITAMLGKRLLTYALFACSSLTLAGFTIVLWIKEREKERGRLPFYFGMMALCFGIYSCYPFFSFFHLPVTRLLYSIQDACICAALYFAYLSILYLKDPIISIRKRLLPFSIVVISFCMPFILPYLPAFVQPYGWMLSVCKLGIAGYMLFVCIRIIKQAQREGSIVLFALLSYAGLLIVHVLTMNRFEPADGAWFEEYGVFILVIFFAWLMVTQTAALWKHDHLLSIHLQEEVDRQTRQISKLLDERRSLLAELLHDVKKPAASAMTYLEMMDKEKTDIQMKKDLSQLRENNRLMMEQLQLLQSFNEQDHIPILKKPLELCSFLQQMEALFAPDAEAYDIDFQFSCTCDRCEIFGDSKQLKRMIQNLFFNALSYAPAQTCISMTLEKKNAEAILQFKNQGEVIPQEELQHIFERGYSSRKKEGGTGLGLFIVHTIVILHQGSIQAASDKDSGTCFTIRLPLYEVIS